MRCIDRRPAAALLGLALLAACRTEPPPVRAAAPAAPAGPVMPAAAVAAPPGAVAAAARGAPPSTRPARTIAEYRLQAAARLMAANPAITYTAPAPDPLLAIPVLEIEVNGDGSIRHITVKRVPTQAADTVQIAIDAVRRAAPFGDATQLPRPWKFTEVFLFDDDRRFKPRILD